MGLTLTDMQFLYEDLFQLTVLAIVIALTPPFHRLTSANTPSSLKSFPALFSLVGHILLLLAAQIAAFEVVQTLPCDNAAAAPPNGSASADDGSDNTTSSYNGPLVWMADIMPTGCERWACFTVGALQIVFLSFVFATGPPFRKPLYTNCKWRVTGNVYLR